MKFHQLPIGARFRFRDAIMCKVSPLKAVNEADGTHRLVPRSAQVQRLGDDDLPAAQLPMQLDGASVEAAAWRLLDDIRQAANGITPALDDDQARQLGATLESAVQRMLQRLSGN